MFFTSKEVDKNDATYKSLVKILTSIDRSGGTYMARGNCIASSEMIRLALLSEGIKSYNVECSVNININANNALSITAVGIEGLAPAGEIDTHMVTVTDTPVPYLIDASIGHKLPQECNVVIDVARKNSGALLQSELHIKNGIVKLLYTEKKHRKATSSYQMSIIDRMMTDAKIFKEIEYLKKLNYIGIAASLFSICNTILNVTMLYK